MAWFKTVKLGLRVQKQNWKCSPIRCVERNRKESRRGNPVFCRNVNGKIVSPSVMAWRLCFMFLVQFVLKIHAKARKHKHISSRIAGPGELFSSDFRACARSPSWATHCSFGSVSCSCNAAPRSVVRKRALPIASSLLIANRAAKNMIDFCQADRNLSSKNLASYFG